MILEVGYLCYVEKRRDNISKKTNKRKFLLVSPMLDFGPFLPLNISIIIAILEKAGYDIKLFDTTFYKHPVDDSWADDSIKIGIFKPVSWDGYGMDNLKEDYIKDFKELVKSYKPDFIGISIFTTFNEKIALSFIDAIDDDFEGKVIIGGIHTYINLDRVKTYKKIDAIIPGECEDMLLDALNVLYEDKKDNIKIIPNFVYRDGNKWIDSGKYIVSDFENIPFLNWDYFDKRNFFRPFEGKVLRMGHVEMARGCPFGCSYCINEHFHHQFPNFWRVKSVKRMLDEVRYLKEKYELDSIKIWDDDFLAIGRKKITEVTAGLKELDLKFLCHSRPEHMDKENIKTLAKNGCIQIGVGVESGNPEYRIKMLKRKMSDEKIIQAFKNCRDYNIIASAYCMIGMPDETREDILSTARLLRRANPHVIVHAIFGPYEGNSLFDYAKSKGYVDENVDYQNLTKSYLKMPSISQKEVEKLNKTFILYSRLDDSCYPMIKKAEEDNKIFGDLIKKIKTYPENTNKCEKLE